MRAEERVRSDLPRADGDAVFRAQRVQGRGGKATLRLGELQDAAEVVAEGAGVVFDGELEEGGGGELDGDGVTFVGLCVEPNVERRAPILGVQEDVEEGLRLQGDEVAFDSGGEGGVDGHLGTSFVEVVHELRLIEKVREGDEGLGVREGNVDGITRDEFRDDEGS